MNVATNIYKAYDIRGIYGTELTEEVAYKTARACAQLIQSEHLGAQLTMVVGQDMRVSSPALTQEVIRGLTDEGVHVVDIGLVSTPAFYFAVAKYDYDGGIMVSASHNPPEYNGLKMVRAGAAAISGDTGILTIRDTVIADKTFGQSTTQGSVTKRDDIIVEHVKIDSALANLNLTDTQIIKPFTVVADAANSMGATYLRETFKHIPQCTLVKMNFELDGTFPAHEADPFKEANNAALMQQVVAQKADLGIATDGDGDRIFFVDNEGVMIDPAIVRGVLAKVFLEETPGATICYDIRPGRITRDLIEEAGGKPCVTKVGHSLIKEQALKEGAVFAGESSGHFFVNMPHGMFEAPVIVMLKLMAYFSRSEQTIADQVRPYRKYAHSGEINSEVEDKIGMMQKLQNLYGPQATSVSALDGITIEYPDYWFNVRASNTESVLRLNLESISQDMMQTKRDEILAIIRGTN